MMLKGHAIQKRIIYGYVNNDISKKCGGWGVPTDPGTRLSDIDRTVFIMTKISGNCVQSHNLRTDAHKHGNK